MEKTIEKNEEMFCYQCQETAKNIACTKKGVCGKTSDVANYLFEPKINRRLR